MFNNCNWIEIEFDNEGEAYFTFADRKWFLSEFMSLNDQEYHGYLTLCNNCSLVILIHPAGDAVKAEFIS
jgi:hypothetical protein